MVERQVSFFGWLPGRCELLVSDSTCRLFIPPNWRSLNLTPWKVTLNHHPKKVTLESPGKGFFNTSCRIINAQETRTFCGNLPFYKIKKWLRRYVGELVNSCMRLFKNYDISLGYNWINYIISFLRFLRLLQWQWLQCPHTWVGNDVWGFTSHVNAYIKRIKTSPKYPNSFPDAQWDRYI